MRGEGVGQPERGGQLRAERAGAENPHVDVRAGTRRRDDPGLAVVREIALQFHHVLREGIGVGFQRAAHRAGDALIGAGRAAETEVDAAGEQRVERAELLRDRQRRVVGEHDAARTDADRAGRRGDVCDHDRGRGRRDAGHAVMFGDPIALEPDALGVAREVGGVGERLGNGAAFDDGDEIEQGIACHPMDIGTER